MQYLVIDGMTIPLKGGISGGTGGPAYSDTDIYSTEEQMIGYWIDKKPLYRKVIQTQTPTAINALEDIISADDLEALNLDFISKLEAMAQMSTGSYMSVPNYFSDGSTTYSYCFGISYSSSGSIKMSVSNSMNAAQPCYVILEYTKTTDSPVESIPTASSLMSTMVTEGLNDI